MIGSELKAARALISQRGGHQKSNLLADHLDSLGMIGIKVVDMVTIVIPDIQNALWWDTHTLIGKNLVGTYHLEQGDYNCSKRKRGSQIPWIYSCYAQTLCHSQHILI